MQQHTIRRTLGGSLLLGGALALAACGGGGGGSSDLGSLTLGITDGPVEEAENVFVQFSSVTLKPSGVDDDDGDNGNGGDAANDDDDNPAFVTIEFDEPKRIDLLEQQNGNSALLVENESIPAGDYDWIRLGVDLGSGETVIVFPGPDPVDPSDDETHDLKIPSGAQTGLKLVTPFSVEQGGTLDLTIDFDLRKSVVEASPGKFILKPALRLVNNDATGEIAASATMNYILNLAGGSGCADLEAQAVYVFEGDDAAPDDINTDDMNDVDPVTTISLTDPNDDDLFTGTAGFLPEGDYTVAFTCTPELDVADQDDDGDVAFVDALAVEVEVGETTEYNLPLP